MSEARLKDTGERICTKADSFSGGHQGQIWFIKRETTIRDTNRTQRASDFNRAQRATDFSQESMRAAETASSMLLS